MAITACRGVCHVRFRKADAFRVAQYGRVRELLNVGANSNAVKHLGAAVADRPPIQITRSELWGPAVTVALNQAFTG